MIRSKRTLTRRSIRAAALLLILLFGATSPALAQVTAEKAKLFEAVRAADMRVATIGWRLATANAALCDRLEPGTGIQLHTLDQFDSDEREAAGRHFGFATQIAVEGVVAGGPAESAGLRADDSLVRIGPIEISAIAGKPQTTDRLVAAQLALAALPPDTPVRVDALRDGKPIQVTIQPIPACKSRFELRIARDYGASADGTMVQISSQFLENYPDQEVAGVMAHEFAHNVWYHRARLEEKGVDFGLLAGFGANVKYFRQTELQADILSVYLLANAGYSPRASIAFWKRFGPSKAGGIFRSRSHPHWKDRVATLEAEIARLERLSIRPARPAILTERGQPLSGDWQSLLVRKR